jgi:hypothetical protein
MGKEQLSYFVKSAAVAAIGISFQLLKALLWAVQCVAAAAIEIAFLVVFF